MVDLYKKEAHHKFPESKMSFSDVSFCPTNNQTLLHIWVTFVLTEKAGETAHLCSCFHCFAGKRVMKILPDSFSMD